ncbi:MAG TPA: peptidase M28, partial [Armatimonadota bacterium]|nr:peptidase M28 [Armatimonadota bacterium]
MIPDVSGARALAHVREICERFGSRPAGSEKERKAAEHIAARFREFGLSEVVIEPFPCLTWDYSR